MKSNPKIKTIILIVIGILFAVSPIITTNFSFIASNNNRSSKYSEEINVNNEDIKISAVSEKIHIDNNWTAAKSAGIVTGNGTYSEPYITEDLVIDGGGSGSGILIENSNVYFRIENCTVYNSGRDYYDAGIKLSDVSNGKLINNNLSFNYIGIYLTGSNNNTLSYNNVSFNENSGISITSSQNNTLFRNDAFFNYNSFVLLSSDDNILSSNNISYNYYGIYLGTAENNKLLGNTVLYNDFTGISMDYYSYHNTLSGNIMEGNGIVLGHNTFNNYIDTTNLVNGKPVYYYEGQIGLEIDGLTNIGQLILVNCSNSLISKLNISHTTYAISLYYCNNNTISGNNASYTENQGIWLFYSDNNIVSGNIANYNVNNGIAITDSKNNNISGNTVNNNKYGIILTYSDNNLVSGNIIYENIQGIRLVYSDNNIASRNIANDNWQGIRLFYSNNNTISGNNVINNSEYGIALEEFCIGNNIYLNSFDNSLNAVDDSSDNHWDNGSIGNEWSDYLGKDTDDDSIGDIPYTIPGTAGSQDNYPIWWDAPIISIISPVVNSSFQNIAPQFNISIEGIPDSMWYTIEGILGNFPFTELNFSIDQPTWDNLTEGPITVTLYVQDSRIEIGTISIVIIKSTPYAQGIPGYYLLFLLGILSVVAIILSKKIKKS